MFSQSVPWVQNGNGGTVPGTDFIGTTDPADLVFKINGLETFRLLSGGNAGLNIPAPTGQLHLHSPQTVATAGYGAVAPVLECCSLAAALGPITGAFTGFKITNNYTGTTVNDGFLLNENDLDAQILNQENGRVTIGTNNKNVLYMTQTWRMGINEPNPTEQLHVNGNVRVTAIGGSGNGLVTADASGVLGRMAFSGASGEVLTGAGSWASMTTLLAASTPWNYTDTRNAQFLTHGIGPQHCKLTAGSACYPSLDYGLAYIGWNGLRSHSTSDWTFKGDGANNGGVVSYGLINGEWRLVSVPSTGAGDQILPDGALSTTSGVYPYNMLTWYQGRLAVGMSPYCPIPGSMTHCGMQGLFVAGYGRFASTSALSDAVYVGHDGANGFIDLQDTKSGNKLLLNYYSGKDVAIGSGSSGNLFVAGNVGIGTGNFSGFGTSYRLSVNGNILAKGIRIRSDWADYVFCPDYELPSLAELRSYIDAHGHLPGVLSADEVASDGVDVGTAMQQLLEKVEELTLYLLQQEEKIQGLEQSLKEVQDAR